MHKIILMPVTEVHVYSIRRQLMLYLSIILCVHIAVHCPYMADRQLGEFDFVGCKITIFFTSTAV